MPFRSRPDHELGLLSDEDLIAYVRAAADASKVEAARQGLQILVFGYWDHVMFRVGLKLPPHAVEDVAADVIMRAVSSSFAGESVGQFRSWLNTIMQRAVAQFYRERERTIETHPLDRGDDDESPRDEPGVVDQSGFVETQMILERVLDGMRDDHRRAVEIVVLEDRSAADAADELPGMTADNAYQIVRRFRVELRRELEAGDNEPT